MNGFRVDAVTYDGRVLYGATVHDSEGEAQLSAEQFWMRENGAGRFVSFQVIDTETGSVYSELECDWIGDDSE